MKHIFKTTLNWIKKEPISDSSERFYTKSHHISNEGKPNLEISAAKAFKGDPNLYNPEDLLLSSLTSCHMMSYLYCCAQHKIEVISYTDHSEATLVVNADGSGKIIVVNLFPEVIIADETQIELALSLHKKANELCFIANSCNFPVYHNSTCTTP
ncbi:OsmC family protein [Empedobacter stercoris]|uniref:OsmC family protein n=1 Tax=Empedobacter stercoris TaxID=1628248 RepID=UPI001CE0CC74|nr:OsmC family protein [Empedobacter stercoris]MCA4777860.1 OsmC family protein [Empedobacter stercoris]MCA4782843.1 OsmC family protein [Empedobacter stercoris]